MHQSSSLNVTVIVCSHNPREPYIQRVIQSLASQTFQNWELIVVDNASDTPLVDLLRIPERLNFKIVSEGRLGLTYARLRGITEANGDLLVFVDDDNVLAPDYLAIAAQIAKERPYIAAFGGSIVGEYEKEVPQEMLELLPYLAVSPVSGDSWGNSITSYPPGAGLCLRAEVAKFYFEEVLQNASRLKLDRKGASLVSGGDTDIILTALENGYGVGRFKNLHLTHLIPATRLQWPYLLALVEDITYSEAAMRKMGRFDSLTGSSVVPPPTSWRRRLLNAIRVQLMPRHQRKLHRARERGIQRALSAPEVI